MITFPALKAMMQDLKVPSWNVKGKNSSLIGYEDDNSISMDISVARLEKLLNGITGDYVRVELHPGSKTKTGGGKLTDYTKVVKVDVDLSTMPGRSAVTGLGAVHSVNSGKVDQLQERILQLEKEVIEHKYLNQIAELRKEIAGVKDQDPMNKLLETLLPSIIGALSPGQTKPMALAGTPDDIMNKFISLDPQGGAVVGALVWLIENNVEKYNMYKPILLDMAHGK